MTRRLKLQIFFSKYHLGYEKEIFDYLLKMGAPFYVLRILLWRFGDKAGVSFDCTHETILAYARREGLYGMRREAILARKSKRKFVRKDKRFSTKNMKEMLR